MDENPTGTHTSSDTPSFTDRLTTTIADCGLNTNASRLLALQLLTASPTDISSPSLHIVGTIGPGIDCHTLTNQLEECSPQSCQYISADRVSLKQLFGTKSSPEDGYLLDPNVDITVIEASAQTNQSVTKALAQAMRSNTHQVYAQTIEEYPLQSKVLCLYRPKPTDVSTEQLLANELYPFVGAADVFADFYEASNDLNAETLELTELPTDSADETISKLTSAEAQPVLSRIRSMRPSFSEAARSQYQTYRTTVKGPRRKLDSYTSDSPTEPKIRHLIESRLRDSIKPLAIAVARGNHRETVLPADVYAAIEQINQSRTYCEIYLSEAPFWVLHTDQVPEQGISDRSRSEPSSKTYAETILPFSERRSKSARSKLD